MGGDKSFTVYDFILAIHVDQKIAIRDPRDNFVRGMVGSLKGTFDRFGMHVDVRTGIHISKNKRIERIFPGVWDGFNLFTKFLMEKTAIWFKVTRNTEFAGNS